MLDVDGVTAARDAMTSDDHQNSLQDPQGPCMAI